MLTRVFAVDISARLVEKGSIVGGVEGAKLGWYVPFQEVKKKKRFPYGNLFFFVNTHRLELGWRLLLHRLMLCK